MHRLLTIDLHAVRDPGFFDLPVDNLYAASVLLDHLKKLQKDTGDEMIIVSRTPAAWNEPGPTPSDSERDWPSWTSGRDVPNQAQSQSSKLGFACITRQQTLDPPWS